MDQLRPIELNLIDDLTGMSSGYVLDFTNRTFADFFLLEVGVDIDDDVYSEAGGSKGKRLRSFLRKGQKRAIVQALHAIWEYREDRRMARGEPDPIPNARDRLSAIIERLGGTPLTRVAGEPSECKQPAGRVEPTAVEDLKTRFVSLAGLEPQPRGYAFERFLTDLFNAWQLDARGGFRLTGEQIDGSFQHDGSTYLVEAKWQKDPTNAATLHAFQGKIEERPHWTRGLFVSCEGFTREALGAFTARRVILMDGADIYEALDRMIPLPEIITGKARFASEFKNPFARVRVLFPI